MIVIICTCVYNTCIYKLYHANIYIIIYACIYSKKGAMDLKEMKEKYLGGF